RIWAGGGQLDSGVAGGVLVPIDSITGIGELKLGTGSALKNKTVDFDAAFIKTNPLATSGFLSLEFFQRRVGSPTKFNVEKFDPLEAPFNGGTQAQRQTSVSII